MLDIRIVDTSRDLVISEAVSDLKISTNIAYDVTSSSIKASITGAGQPASYDLTMGIEHQL